MLLLSQVERGFAPVDEGCGEGAGLPGPALRAANISWPAFLPIDAFDGRGKRDYISLRFYHSDISIA
jgi:hypothetical protein